MSTRNTVCCMEQGQAASHAAEEMNRRCQQGAGSNSEGPPLPQSIIQ
jgi:hypothetical protein